MRTSLDFLPHMLIPGERLELIETALRRWSFGVVALTDKRFIFAGIGGLRGLDVVFFDYDEIEEMVVGGSSDLTRLTLRVAHREKPVKFSSTSHYPGPSDSFIIALRSHLTRARVTAGTEQALHLTAVRLPNAAAEDDPSGELARARQRYSDDRGLSELLEFLPYMLIPHEKLELIEKTQGPGLQGILVLTDRRVVYLGERLRGRKVVFFHLREITDISLGSVDTDIRIHVVGKKRPFVFPGIKRQERASEIVGKIGTRLTWDRLK